MYQLLAALLIVPLLLSSSSKAIQSAVSYELNGGRFGDNLRSLTQAYWESYKHNLPFFYVPFPGSEELMLHELLKPLTPEVKAQYRGIIKIEEYQQLLTPHRENILYITTYFCKTDIDWNNREFLDKVKQLLTPLKPIALPDGIDDAIVLHVRRGGGFHVDTAQLFFIAPGHFPDITYFARALDHLLPQLQGKQIVYMFTDDPNPPAIAQQLLRQLRPETAERVDLRYRTHDNFHDRHVLEDFVAMQHARYLIRPISNFSEYAELLGNTVCTVFPARHRSGRPYGIVESAVFLYKDRPAEVILLLH